MRRRKRNRIITLVTIVSFIVYSFSFQKVAIAETTANLDQLDFIESEIKENLDNMGLENIEVTAQLPMSAQSELLDSTIEESPEIVEEIITEEAEASYDELVIKDEDLLSEIKDNYDILTDEVEKLIDENDLIIQVIGLDDQGTEFTSTIGLNLGEEEIKLVTDGENSEEHVYSLDLEELDQDNISGTMTDLETGELIEISSYQGEYTTSAVFVPALGITVGTSLLAAFAIAVAASTLIYLAAQGLISLYKGALWVAGKVAQEQKNNRKWVHYEARRVNNKHGILVGPGRSQTKATNRLKSNLDVWSINSTQAKKIAKAASVHKDTLYHSPHKASKGIRTFHHYHPKGKSSHSFYGAGRLN